jgi:glycerophosphoryl diester phosphodiesterase
VLMSFEPTTLRTLADAVEVPLLQLLEPVGAPADLVAAGDPRDHTDLVTAEGLAEIAGYAAAVGPDKAQVIAPTGAPTGLVERARAVGLRVLPYTFRNENLFLPPDLRTDADPAAFGDAFAEYAAHLAAGVDGWISDHPDTAVSAREAALESV